MNDPEDDERERQSAMQLKHAMSKIVINAPPPPAKYSKENELIHSALVSANQTNEILKQKIKHAMTAFNEILDDIEEAESRKDLIAEICKEALGELK